jgi:hypothetical protein
LVVLVAGLAIEVEEVLHVVGDDRELPRGGGREEEKGE